MLNSWGNSINEESQKRQLNVDTRAEYEQVSVSCNGELQEITRRFIAQDP